MKPLKSLENKLDKVFSEFIRKRDANHEGMGNCISCGAWAKLQAGHFIKRQHKKIRWDERNCHGQCPRCNLFLSGNEGEYSQALRKKLGGETVDELFRLKGEVAKHSRAELEEMIEKYKGMVDHNCPVEGRMMIERGKECSWCGKVEP